MNGLELLTEHHYDPPDFVPEDEFGATNRTVDLGSPGDNGADAMEFEM